MKTILRLIDNAAQRMTGVVQAGACIAEHGCCCMAGTIWAYDCNGNCVSADTCRQGCI